MGEPAARARLERPDAVIEYHVDTDRDYAGDEFDEAHDRAIWTDTVRRSPDMHRDEGGADVFEDAPRWSERLGQIQSKIPSGQQHFSSTVDGHDVVLGWFQPTFTNNGNHPIELFQFLTG